MKITNEQFTHNASDGTALFARMYYPENPVAVINLIHGHGEHSSRYKHWIEAFCSKNIAVHTFDLRGHGKSEGKRGHTPSYEHLLYDIDLLLQKSGEKFTGIKQILYGHSMGGNLVLNYAIRRKQDFDALIATSPWLKLAFEPSKLQVFMAKTLLKIYPSFIQHSKLPAEYISRNKMEVSKYKNDKLVHDLISLQLFISVHNSGLYALQNADKLHIPTLLLHGSGDKITSHTASNEFHENNPSTIDFKLFDELFHELHNADEKEEVMDYIWQWLKTNIL